MQPTEIIEATDENKIKFNNSNLNPKNSYRAERKRRTKTYNILAQY
jgi:hypothetical protein